MREIPLTKGQVALVDDDLWEELLHYKWQAIKRRGNGFYASAAYPLDNKHKVYMHHLVSGWIPSQVTHHKDGNPLNNQRENLVCVTPHEHMMLHNPGAALRESRPSIRVRGPDGKQKDTRWGIVVCARIPPEEYDLLDARATANGEKVAQLLARLIHEWAEKGKSDADTSPRS